MGYTVTWLNYNGTLLQEDEDIPEGMMPFYIGITPVKPEDDEYTYTFKGWTPEVVPVTENATYTATFEAHAKTPKYIIEWLNYDGTLLQKDEDVSEGLTPFYIGPTPVRPGDDEYTYVFSGWTPEIVPVTGDATYTAVFEATKKSYTITWKNDDDSTIDTTSVEYGEIPTHANAMKADTYEYTYVFSGWTPEIVAVTGEATYTATFETHTKTTPYDLKSALPNKLLNSDGTITDMAGEPITDTVDAYENKPAIPNKFLNPDGTYSTLSEIIASGIDTDIFVIVNELPQEGDPKKIYLVPDGDGGFNEYHWTGTAWDPIGTIDFDPTQYYTKTQTDSNFLKKDNTTAYTPSADYHPATKKYVDDNMPIGTELDIDKNATIPSGWQEVEYDTDWVDLTLDTTKCSIAPSSGANANTDFTPQIRRIGNIVYLRGKVVVTKDNISSAQTVAISSAINSKFLPDASEINIPFYSLNGEYGSIYVGSQTRTDANASKLCLYMNSSKWSSVPATFQVTLTQNWTVDSLSTKRIKRIS